MQVDAEVAKALAPVAGALVGGFAAAAGAYIVAIFNNRTQRQSETYRAMREYRIEQVRPVQRRIATIMAKFCELYNVRSAETLMDKLAEIVAELGQPETFAVVTSAGVTDPIVLLAILDFVDSCTEELRPLNRDASKFLQSPETIVPACAESVARVMNAASKFNETIDLYLFGIVKSSKENALRKPGLVRRALARATPNNRHARRA